MNNERVEEQDMKTRMPVVSLCSTGTYWQWYALTVSFPGEIIVRTPASEPFSGHSCDRRMMVAE